MIEIASRQLTDLIKSLPESLELFASGLRGSSRALIAAAVQEHESGPILVVLPTQEEAEAFTTDLRFFLGNSRSARQILCYPAWDVGPYEQMSPHADITIQRIGALATLQHRPDTAIVVAPAPALLKRVIPPDVLAHHSHSLAIGMDIDREALMRDLPHAGYLSTDIVEDAGCMSVRGGIVDLFPPLYDHPVRLELFGDTIESIREFDPATQRSLRHLEKLTVLPVREEILAPDYVARVTSRLKAYADQHDRPSHLRRQIGEDLAQGIFFPGIEYHLGLFYSSLSLITEYLPGEGGRLILIEPDRIHESLETHFDRIKQHFLTYDTNHRLVPPHETLFASPDVLDSQLSRFPRLMMAERVSPSKLDIPRIQFKVEPTSGLRQSLISSTRDSGLLEPFVERLTEWSNSHLAVYVICRTTIQALRLKDLLETYNLHVPECTAPPPLEHFLNPAAAYGASLLPILGEISEGFRFPDGRLVALSDEDIFGKKVRTSTVSRQNLRNAVSSFSQLNRGDYVVHATHGVGVFKGLSKLGMGGGDNDFITVEYEGGDKLYLPVHRLNTLQKYVGQGAQPRLDKMGGVTFARAKRKAKEGILKMAHELLQLYAARAVLKGHAFHIDRRQLETFEASFAYEETPDQLSAIQAVYQDMVSERPMDRLVCGDVGYGKTEVAIRAAFVAALDGKQVLVLVPTTVLALQHYRSFKERLQDYPVTIDMLTRFRSPSEQAAILRNLKRGGIDIIIGTHRLLSPDLEFKDLGLLIVDEEHRFGVTHKERIKKLRKDLDVLTLTATPIPRTLNMALSGLREFSLITTPPRDRMAIRTYHAEFSPSQIQEAVRLELKRGGQVFFVHNRVQSIHAMATLLNRLVPEAKVGIAHGQMDEHQLERILVDFIDRRYDVLCCTAIIESGLDIPSANTILINRADQFGLAQLYQIRGRVGRSSRRAFCYLLTPAGRRLTQAAERRLTTLVNATELGAGFKIASEDLEIRGAGNLLGSSQSGSIQAVGLDMYCELLEQSIHELRGEEVLEDIEPDIDLRMPAYIPESYIVDLHSRLHHYKSLSDARTDASLLERFEEMEDRYGASPAPARNLLELMRIRLLLRDMRIRSLSYASGRLQLRFDESSLMNRNRLVSLITEAPHRFKLTLDQRLSVILTDDEARDLSRSVKNLLQSVK